RIAVLDVVPGQTVQAGEPIAQLVSEQLNTVTANIQETEVHSIKVGQYVDVYVNAYPNDTFPGRVVAVVPATQASLSFLPSTQSSGSFTPVTQRVPVVIQFQNPNGARLYMGMSVEVRVHITGNP
ncbi:secretion protein HlyD family protein, partial [mine drainage metagenome]